MESVVNETPITEGPQDIALEQISSSKYCLPAVAPVSPPAADMIISFTYIRNKWGKTTSGLVRSIERTDFRAKKALLDKKFLKDCLRHEVFPRFLNLKIGPLNNKSQRRLISEFKTNSLKNEIHDKKKVARISIEEKLEFQQQLLDLLGSEPFELIREFIIQYNSKKLSNVESLHFKKFNKLVIQNGRRIYSECDKELNSIFNESSHDLSTEETSALKNGLGFIPTPNKIDEIELYAYLEHFASLIYNRDNDPNSIASIASKFNREICNSIERFKHNKPINNISFKERQALITLSKNKNLVISKPDKGNGIVLVNKDDYIMKMLGILKDSSKFQELLDFDIFKHTLSLETKVRKILTDLKKSKKIDIFTYKRCYPTGSRPCILYGLPKVHKKNTPMRPIMSAVSSPVHGLAKLLVPWLAPITINDYTVNNSLVFAEELRISGLNNLYLASFDITSLFTNIPLDETIDLILKANTDKRLSKKIQPGLLKRMLGVASKDCVFQFNNSFFLQKDGVAMGSPLGPTMANIFMCHFEDTHLKECLHPYKPVFYKRYVDDILLGFNKKEDIEKFLDYYNIKHPNIKFTLELETPKGISFLDIDISKDCNQIITKTFRKSTFTGSLLKHNSFLHEKYKGGLILCLLFRAFKICSSLPLFEKEVTFLKKLFRKNRFPDHLFDQEYKKFKNKYINISTPPTNTPLSPSQNDNVINSGNVIDLDKNCGNLAELPNPQEGFLTLKLPFYGQSSLTLRNGIKKSLNETYPDLKVRIVFSGMKSISSFFRFKDKIPGSLQSNLIYRFICSTCQVDYIGCTRRHLRTRIGEHLGISSITGLPLNSRNPTVIKKHLLDTGHDGTEDDFEILYSSPDRQYNKIIETILIQRETPKLNDTIGSFPLRIHPSSLGSERFEC